MKILMKELSWGDYSAVGKDYYMFLNQMNNTTPKKVVFELFNRHKYCKALSYVDKAYGESCSLLNDINNGFINFIGLYSDNKKLVAHTFIDFTSVFSVDASNALCVNLNHIFIRNSFSKKNPSDLEERVFGNIVMEFISFIESYLATWYFDINKVYFKVPDEDTFLNNILKNKDLETFSCDGFSFYGRSINRNRK